MKATFTVEWKDGLSPGWMNKYNLLSCLTTDTHCGEGLILGVEDTDKDGGE